MGMKITAELDFELLEHIKDVLASNGRPTEYESPNGMIWEYSRTMEDNGR